MVTLAGLEPAPSRLKACWPSQLAESVVVDRYRAGFAGPGPSLGKALHAVFYNTPQVALGPKVEVEPSISVELNTPRLQGGTAPGALGLC